jgi:hypothetical protein
MADDLPKLLRALAGSEHANEHKHDIILNAAADEIERSRRATRGNSGATAMKWVILNSLGEICRVPFSTEAAAVESIRGRTALVTIKCVSEEEAAKLMDDHFKRDFVNAVAEAARR